MPKLKRPPGLQKNGVKNGVVYWRLVTPRKTYSLGAGKERDAIEAAEFILASHNKGIQGQRELHEIAAMAAGRSAVAFADLVDDYLASIIEIQQPTAATLSAYRADIPQIKAFFGEMYASEITASLIKRYRDAVASDKSANVKNRKVLFLAKLLDYAMDDDQVQENAARRVKLLPTAKTIRQKISFDDYLRVLRVAPDFLKTAMQLALQTTQAVDEIVRIQFNMKSPKDGECGCVWFAEPVEQQGQVIYGTLYIHRTKTQKNEASRIAIPIGDEIKRVVDESQLRASNMGWQPKYVVWRRPDRINRQQYRAKDCIFAVKKQYLSRKFSAYRDIAGVQAAMKPEARATFHCIRALAAKIYSDQGVDVGKRMAHADERSTNIYLKGHAMWASVEHAEIKIGEGK